MDKGAKSVRWERNELGKEVPVFYSFSKKEAGNAEKQPNEVTAFFALLGYALEERKISDDALSFLDAATREEVCKKIVDLIERETKTAQDKKSVLSYTLLVDHDRPITESIERGKYHSFHEEILTENFPRTYTGKATVTIELLPPQYIPESREGFVSSPIQGILRDLSLAGYRPATIHELLALGECLPELQYEFDIYALSPPVKKSFFSSKVQEKSLFPCLCSKSGRRYLALPEREELYIHPNSKIRFAAVKITQQPR